VLIAAFPYLNRIYDRAHAREHAWLAELARNHGLHHLDLRPSFRTCMNEGDGDSMRFDRYHPTPAGHECAARAMAAAVEPLLPAAGEPARSPAPGA